MAQRENHDRRRSLLAGTLRAAVALAAGAVYLQAGAGAGAGAGGAPGQGSQGEPRDLLYVTNQAEASVAVVDLETLEKVETVDLQEHGRSANAQPHHVAVEPDGSAWYVSLIGDNAVLKFDRENELQGSVELEAPGLMAAHPERDELYIARSMSAVDPPRSLGVARRSEFSLVDEIDVLFPRPHALALPGDGRFLLSASLTTNQLIGVDAESARGELSLLDGPTHVVVQMAVSPWGDEVVATGQMTGELLFLELHDDGRMTQVDVVEVGAQPWHAVYGPEGKRVYVPNKQSNTVSVVDAQAREVVATLRDDSFAQPHGAAVSPDGRHLFVSNNHQPMMMERMAREMAAGAEAPPSPEVDPEGMGHEEEERPGTLSVIDLESLEVVEEITVGMYATGVGTRPR